MGEAVGIRVPEDMLAKIDALGKDEGDDRSTTVRRLIRRGYIEVQRERAAQAYREGRLTLSSAAAMAEWTVWEMQQYLVQKGYRSEYSLEDLAEDLRALGKRR